MYARGTNSSLEYGRVGNSSVACTAVDRVRLSDDFPRGIVPVVRGAVYFRATAEVTYCSPLLVKRRAGPDRIFTAGQVGGKRTRACVFIFYASGYNGSRGAIGKCVARLLRGTARPTRGFQTVPRDRLLLFDRRDYPLRSRNLIRLLLFSPPPPLPLLP